MIYEIFQNGDEMKIATLFLSVVLILTLLSGCTTDGSVLSSSDVFKEKEGKGGILPNTQLYKEQRQFYKSNVGFKSIFWSVAYGDWDTGNRFATLDEYFK